jgi:nicotinate-nucleotide adenylyltransferase
MMSRRVAIYGGTFDPVHNGHVEVARRVLKLFELDEIVFVPACVPPHKRNANITSPFHRFAMLALATEMDQGLLVSTIELDAPDRPYAVDTVERMRAELGDQTELFFLVGADSWLEIKTWREWRRLLTLCNFIVMTRPGYELTQEAIAGMPIPVLNVMGPGCRPQDMMKMRNESPHAYLTDAVQSDICAVQIRAAIKRNDFASVMHMVPARVAAHIEKHRLYID